MLGAELTHSLAEYNQVLGISWCFQESEAE